MHLLPYAVHRAVSALNYPATCNPAGCRWKNDEFSLFLLSFLPMKISWKELLERESRREWQSLERDACREVRLGWVNSLLLEFRSLTLLFFSLRVWSGRWQEISYDSCDEIGRNRRYERSTNFFFAFFSSVSVIWRTIVSKGFREANLEAFY